MAVVSRPDFLTQPGTWVRASRLSQTPAEYAAAVEHHTQRATAHVVRVIAAYAAVLIGTPLVLHLITVNWPGILGD